MYAKQEKARNDQKVKLLLIWVAWLGIFLGQELSPAGYYDSGNGALLNAGTTLILMILVGSLLATDWSRAYLWVGIAQILLNLADQIRPWSEEAFNAVAGPLNLLEWLLLFFIGGIMTFRGWYADYRNRMDTGAGRHRHL